MPITRLTYSGDPPACALVRDRLRLDRADYLYVTATAALEAARSDLASPRQQTDNGSPLRFDRVLRLLLGSQPVLPLYQQRVDLQRGVRVAIQDPRIAEAVRHDVTAWLAALGELEQRGLDVTGGVSPDLLNELTSPALAPILTALQKGYRDAVPLDAGLSLEAAARRFLDTGFTPPPLVVMEGFTYLLPLQQHFVQKCLDGDAHVVFLHADNPEQPDGFAALARTYAPYSASCRQQELTTSFDSPGVDLRLLQRGLFGSNPPATVAHDGSVTLTAYAHRHREIRACLERVRHYLESSRQTAVKDWAAEQIAIVTRNSGEFLSILQEEARRLGLLDRLRIEPRLLLLTPLGRFALTLYDLSPDGTFELRANHFETMIASGWLGAAVQQTVDLFAAVRAQAFDRCRSLPDWQQGFDQLAAADPRATELARLPGRGVNQAHLDAWRRALRQVVDLHARLFDNQPRSIRDHIRRLRDELSRLNPHDMRQDEQELLQQILEALEQVVGAALEVDDREMGDLMVGMARGEHGTEEDAPIERTRVQVTTPEGIDSVRREVVFYLGADSTRVPRPAGMPWPFFTLTTDADAERERYLFLAVVRAARQRLHLSYSRQGEDQTYGPSPYLTATARLLGREADLTVAAVAPSAASRPTPHSLPVLAGQADTYDLHDVAAFALCPYRFRLEQFDEYARRFQDRFQVRFLAQGVWLDGVFERLATGGMIFRDPRTLRRAVYHAYNEERDRVAKLFLALGPTDYEVIRRQLWTVFRQMIDDWLDKPRDGKPAPLQRGVRFEHAPPGVLFTVEVDGRTAIVRTGLRHVARIGRYPRALTRVLTHQHWLLPRYRAEEREGGRPGGLVQVQGIEVFAELGGAVRWWTQGIRVALGKDSFPDQYRAYQAQLAERIRLLQAGRFPKHAGDHCELCPARYTCLGVLEG